MNIRSIGFHSTNNGNYAKSIEIWRESKGYSLKSRKKISVKEKNDLEMQSNHIQHWYECEFLFGLDLSKANWKSIYESQGISINFSFQSNAGKYGLPFPEYTKR